MKNLRMMFMTLYISLPLFGMNSLNLTKIYCHPLGLSIQIRHACRVKDTKRVLILTPKPLFIHMMVQAQQQKISNDLELSGADILAQYNLVMAIKSQYYHRYNHYIFGNIVSFYNLLMQIPWNGIEPEQNASHAILLNDKEIMVQMAAYISQSPEKVKCIELQTKHNLLEDAKHHAQVTAQFDQLMKEVE